MLTLTKTDYGLRAVARGTLTVADLVGALAEFGRLQPVAGGFGYLCDQRALGAMPAEVRVRVSELMGLMLGRGLDRVAIICCSPGVAARSNRALTGTPAARFSVAFDGRDRRWEAKALRWVAGTASLDRAA